MPALNEVKGVQATIANIPKDRLATMGYEVEVIVVDNGSANGTPEAARKLGATVVYEPVRGYGSAIRAGLHKARGDIIITTDADGTYPMLAIPPIIRLIDRRGYDFVTADRLTCLDDGLMSVTNKLGNQALSLVMRSLYGLPIKDSQTGMHALRRDLVDKMQLRFDGYDGCQEMEIEACYYCKAKWIEVPIRYYVRVGDSKLKWWKHGTSNMFALFQKRWQR
jgi:glycosyltransferase involved in cell wall biosynthesis